MMDWLAIVVWTVLVFAVGWTVGSTRGYARGVKWGSDFEKRKQGA